MSVLDFMVADCGGTSTNWAFCYNDGRVVQAETQSMHPKYLLDWNTERREKLRAQLPEDISAPLFFYGSGCTNADIAGRVQEVLVRMRFPEVVVYPDTLGACRACCGNSGGSVAILGTGSVLLDYNGSEITKRTGGWGSLIGDEGSGSHFGRLVLRSFLREADVETSPEAQQLQLLIGTQEQVLSHLAAPKAQKWIATIGTKVAALPLVEIHRENIRAFLSTHISDARLLVDQTLHVVGSYGWAQQQLLEEELKRVGLQLGPVIKSPLEKLVNYHADPQ